jgi:hypothetical protein
MNRKIIIPLIGILMLISPIAQTADFGYVVKVDNDKVYIDITDTAKPAVNEKFTVFIEGEELVNPVTKKSLGKIENSIAQGIISEIADNYAVGSIISKKQDLKPGQKVKWTAKPPAAASIIQTAPDKEQTMNVLWKSQPIEGIITSIALEDINGNGSNDLLTAFKHKVTAYKLQNGKLSKILQKEFPISVTIISVEAGKFENSNTHIFVTGFHKLGDRFTTEIFKFENGKLNKVTEFNGFVRAVKPFGGNKTFYTQKVYKSAGDIRKSLIKRLEYENGKFKEGKTVKMPRLNWIYGFTTITENKKPSFVYITSSDKIRMQKKKKKNYVDSAKLFGKTPHIIETGGKNLNFYPRLPVYKNQDEMFVYGIENISKSGLLARAMGMYHYGKLHRLKWENNAFNKAGEAKLSGYLYDITWGKFAGLPDGIICPSVDLNDETVIEVLNY